MHCNECCSVVVVNVKRMKNSNKSRRAFIFRLKIYSFCQSTTFFMIIDIEKGCCSLLHRKYTENYAL